MQEISARKTVTMSDWLLAGDFEKAANPGDPVSEDIIIAMLVGPQP